MATVGGEEGIRTPGTLPGTVVFKTTAIDRSAISPREEIRIFFSLSRLSLLSHMRSVKRHARSRATRA